MQSEETTMTTSGATVQEESKSEEANESGAAVQVATARPSVASRARSARPSQTLKKDKNFRVPSRIPRNLRHWPRTCACCWGVFIPLNLLVVVSLVSGLLLGKLEMQSEIDSNDAYMRQKIADDKFESDLDNLLLQLPTICLSLYHQNENPNDLPQILQTIMTNQTLLEPYLQPLGMEDESESAMETEIDMELNNSTNITNTTNATGHREMEIPQQQQQQQQQQQAMIPNRKSLQEMSKFFAACTKAGGIFRENWLEIFQPLVQEDDTSLTFNFIRCVNRSSPLAFNAIIIPNKQDVYDALPATQAQLYEDSWRQSQQELEGKYLEEGYSDLEALTESYKEATGEEYCAVNMPSAAWFWFTVMTTVGYGNQVPVTIWGRLLTYTLGFLSILLFGGVLATAGGITTHLLNDFMHRFKRRVSKSTKVMVWGVLWCLWMLVITHQAMSFQLHRLEDDLAMNDAYWLAFMSTTTVGFGDFYLDPEGLFVNDLLGLWITFLIGFVFLSSFLTELSQLLGSVVPDLADDLQRNLKYAYDGSEVPEEVWSSSRRRNPPTRTNNHDDTNNNERTTEWAHPVLRGRGQPNNNNNQAPVQVAKPTILLDIEASAVDAQEVIEEAEKHRQAIMQNQKQQKQKQQQKQQQQQQQQQEQPKEQSRPQQGAQPEQKPKPQPPNKQQPVQEEQKKQQRLQPEQKPKPQPPKQQQPEREKLKKQQTTAASTIPKQKMATFVNTGKDPSMAKAELYYKNTRWGPLGHQDPPISVSTYPGDQWYIVANSVYAKLFTVGDGAQQKFTI